LETAASGVHKVLRRGVYRDDALYAWATVGGLVYLSTTPGAATQTPPATTGDCIQIVGFASHADRLDFNPQLYYTVSP
jgi:hypothetical protein